MEDYIIYSNGRYHLVIHRDIRDVHMGQMYICGLLSKIESPSYTTVLKVQNIQSSFF